MNKAERVYPIEGSVEDTFPKKVFFQMFFKSSNSQGIGEETVQR